jgi:uncharacterized protein
MKIFLDIGHPAHVHYFRNLIRLMLDRGHEFFISARDKEVSITLLEKYNIPYYNRGKGAATLPGKLAYMLKADYKILQKAKAFMPDLFLSFASPYAAHIAKYLKRPHISFTDTENARLGILSFAPVTECIVTPSCFLKDFGPKHVRFKGFMELSYLHPNHFNPKRKNPDEFGLAENENFVFLRFVSWGANHDIGQNGISPDGKLMIVRELSKILRVLISAEGNLPYELNKFRINISPEKIHNLLAFSSLYIGEGATMASECAMLGVPAIYVNTLTAGTISRQAKYGLLFHCTDTNSVQQKAMQILQDHNSRNIFQSRRESMLTDQIDVTNFMVWFVENYPESMKVMRGNPDFQDRFK